MNSKQATPAVAVVLAGLAAMAGLQVANQPEPLFSDTFERADADAFNLGVTDGRLGGRLKFGYIPLFPGGLGVAAIGARIHAKSLAHNGKDFGGVELCPAGQNPRQTRGASIGQDLRIQVDLGVRVGEAGHTMAGPYFRGRRAAAGDGMIGGSTSGFWVRLWSSGHVDVFELSKAKPVAVTRRAHGFRPDQWHRMTVTVRGAQLQVRLDGGMCSFSRLDQDGAPTQTLTLPATGGVNEGVLGLAFGSEPRHSTGGQRAANLIVWEATQLETELPTTRAETTKSAVAVSVREPSRKSDAATAAQKVDLPLTRPRIATAPPYLLPPEKSPLGPMASAPTRSLHSGTAAVTATPRAQHSTSAANTGGVPHEAPRKLDAKAADSTRPPSATRRAQAKEPTSTTRDHTELPQSATATGAAVPPQTGKPASQAAGQGMRGDFDGDGRLTARDAEAALQMSAGLREESLILDMDGDGRVLSADARLILQGITGTPPSKPTPVADAKPRSQPPPAVSPAPATVQQPARAERLKAARQSSPFFVTFQMYFPNNLDKLVKQQGGGSGREAFKKLERELMALDVRSVQYKADDSPLILHFQGSSTTAYSPEMFSAGELFSVSVTIEFRGKTTRTLKGALLLKCADVFMSEAQLLAKHPNAVLAGSQPKKSSGSELKPLIVETAEGTFSRDDKLADGSIRISGGPPAKGWSEQTKRQNLQLAAQIAGLCAAESALLADPAAEEKLAQLRRFRDQTLARSGLGRAMIWLYYETFSPWAASLMRHHSSSRAFFRTGVGLAVGGTKRLTGPPPATITVVASTGGIGQ